MAWTRAKVVPQPDDALIDVRDLIGRLSSDDLLASADAYFAGLTIDSEQCHKPFSNIADAIHIHRNLGLLLQAADLFRGAEVLDFGCATGWLTIVKRNDLVTVVVFCANTTKLRGVVGSSGFALPGDPATSPKVRRAE